MSRGDPLGRAEKSGDRTTLFRGQKVKKGSARPPNRYTLKWEAGCPPYGDGRSHDLETRHAPPSWAPHSAPKFEGRSGFLSILCPAARLAKIGRVSGSLLLNSMADKETYEKWGKILFGVLGPGPFGTSLRGSWRSFVFDLGPLGTSEKSPTFSLFEWVQPSGFVDAARKGPIEPNLKSLSQGHPLDRAEKSGDPTTFFGGSKGQKRERASTKRVRV